MCIIYVSKTYPLKFNFITYKYNTKMFYAKLESNKIYDIETQVV